MNYKIALIKGDGIGPEVVMDAIGEKFGHTFEYTDILMGGCAIDEVGRSYPEGTAEKCRACDAVLLGAVGGPRWGHSTDPDKRPETALLSIRKDLGLARRSAARPGGVLPPEKRQGDRPDDRPGADGRGVLRQEGPLSDRGPGGGGQRPDGLLREGDRAHRPPGL